MAQTKITSKSLATNTIAAANIADGAIQSRHIEASLFSPAIYSNKINSSTGYMGLPAGTTAQRPASPQAGAVRFNTEFGWIEWYDSVSALWLKMGETRPAYLNDIPGTTITTITDPDDGFTYRVQTFTTPGNYTLQILRSGSIDLLIVGGGGSGGNRNTTNANGGGGGGGIVYKKNHYVSMSVGHGVTVGGGGASVGFQINAAGNNGGDSSLSRAGLSYIAKGGGGGASSAGVNAKNGGCGGGAAWDENIRGISDQIKYEDAQCYGSAGGHSAQAYTGAGGGGAGSEGVGGRNVTNYSAGDGGFGVQFSISGTRRFYGGGGGGGGNSSEKAGRGWHGGGRGFGTTTDYTHLNYPVVVNSQTLGSGTPDAIDGTGGGGGAGSYWSNNSTNWLNKGSGSGGDGIVILRHRI
jgi:hypothetical protein